MSSGVRQSSLCTAGLQLHRLPPQLELFKGLFIQPPNSVLCCPGAAVPVQSTPWNVPHPFHSFAPGHIICTRSAYNLYLGVTWYCRVVTSPTLLQADEKVSLSAPRLLSLEEAIGYVSGSELVEVTPTAVRVRKEVLDATQRKVQAKKEASY